MNDDKAQGHEPRGQGPDGQEPRGHNGHGPENTRRDTRARIQRVALELFAEQGYETTSLREIAERLDVTKAALYYHFKSKEDIVRSLLEDYVGQIDDLVAWAATQPRTPQTRAAIMSRYVRIVADGHDVFRMLHQNQAALGSLASAKSRGDVFRERMGALVGALTGPDAGVMERLRATMALGGVSVGWMFFADQVDDADQLSDAILQIASEFATARPQDQQPAGSKPVPPG
jgi:AcrR family transcriptional regulator